jgi:hypothetical protein
MSNPIGAIRSMRRQAARRRARQSLRGLSGDLGALGRRLGSVRSDVVGGIVASEASRLARSASRAVPVRGRRRGPSPSLALAPAVVLAGAVAAAGLLLWDGRRRAAMRRRLDEVAASVGTSLGVARGSDNRDRATPPPAAVETRQD